MKESNKKSFLQGVLAGILGCLVLLLVFYGVGKFFFGGIGIITGRQVEALGKNSYQNLNKLAIIHEKISQEFMENVEDETILAGMYKGMLESLEDPYSRYYTQEEYAELNESNSGSYCGIGALVAQDSKTGKVYIVEAYEGGAAKEAGIVAGDSITKVNGKSVKKEELTDVVERMKGKEGTTVEIEFYIAKSKTRQTFTMERRNVEVPSVEYQMLKDNVGYIQVSGFKETTAKQFSEALDKLEKKNMKGLIIDLRDNGGGLLDSVVDMMSRILPEKKEIVSVKDKNGKGTIYFSKDEKTFDKPLVVLVNENTASASEVFAGAVQDYKLGKLVGTTTFGKGIVQTVMGLFDDSAIKLTTAKYYTPNGRNIHKTGLEPDIEVELDEKLQQKGFYSMDEDNQLQKGIQVLQNML
ncbi:MAG: S41 family peptidase [Lachnospiraceae bacterium]|nr:S41 family peptidase [Lachnospiraceae bacterium]